jgi:hypothetical protein
MLKPFSKERRKKVAIVNTVSMTEGQSSRYQVLSRVHSNAI